MKAYILAGGRSTRLGRDKGLATIGGQPMIKYLVNSLLNIDFSVTIVAHDDAYHSLGCPVIQDLIPNMGPLGGILTALDHAKEDVMILSVDTPFLNEKNMLLLHKHSKPGKISVVMDASKIFPLFAVYPYALANMIEESILQGHLRLMGFLDKNKTHVVHLTLSPMEQLNINTEDDLTMAQKYLDDGH